MAHASRGGARARENGVANAIVEHVDSAAIARAHQLLGAERAQRIHTAASETRRLEAQRALQRTPRDRYGFEQRACLSRQAHHALPENSDQRRRCGLASIGEQHRARELGHEERMTFAALRDAAGGRTRLRAQEARRSASSLGGDPSAISTLLRSLVNDPETALTETAAHAVPLRSHERRDLCGLRNRADQVVDIIETVVLKLAHDG